MMAVSIASVFDPFHNSRFLEVLQDFFAKESLTDVCFICKNGQKVRAHQMVLGVVSQLLKQMFLELGGLTQEIVINVPDVSASILKLVIYFLYEGTTRLDGIAEYQEFQNVLVLLGIKVDGSSSKQQNFLPAVNLPQAGPSYEDSTNYASFANANQYLSQASNYVQGPQTDSVNNANVFSNQQYLPPQNIGIIDQSQVASYRPVGSITSMGGQSQSQSEPAHRKSANGHDPSSADQSVNCPNQNQPAGVAHISHQKTSKRKQNLEVRPDPCETPEKLKCVVQVTDINLHGKVSVYPNESRTPQTNSARTAVPIRSTRSSRNSSYLQPSRSSNSSPGNPSSRLKANSRNFSTSGATFNKNSNNIRANDECLIIED